MLQAQVKVEEYYRCYVVGQEKVRIIKYDPTLNHVDRYAKETVIQSKALEQRMTNDALMLCRALGYDLNSVEFAIQDGIPYAIDFLNPAPVADAYSIGQANFEWLVENVATLAINRALEACIGARIPLVSVPLRKAKRGGFGLTSLLVFRGRRQRKV